MDWNDHYEAALRALAKVEDAVNAGDPISALRWLAKTSDHFGDIAMPLAQQALDGGATKTTIAKAINVPPSYFRGMQKTRQVERDPGSGRYYRLDSNGERLHGPYLSEREARA
jgi:hypothetical protein